MLALDEFDRAPTDEIGVITELFDCDLSLVEVGRTVEIDLDGDRRIDRHLRTQRLE